MNRFKTQITLAAGLAVLLLAPTTYAQSPTSLRVSVPFSFKAGSKELPAGTYLFKRDSGWALLSSADGKIKERMPVITYLARSGAADDHLLAFDKVGDTRILSEIWLPRADGFLVHSQSGEHQHELVRLVRKPK